MTEQPRIYLDNAATSWPKPPAVYAAVMEAMQVLGSPAGRGSSAEGLEVDRRIARCRARVAELIAADDPRRIVFTSNGTDSLNQAIHGVLRPGDHVVCSAIDHNSTLRPLRALEDDGRISVTRVGCDGRGVVDPDDVRRAMQPHTRLVVLTHASNVTGAIQPAAEIGRIAAETGALFLLDAAQTLGHLPFSVGDLNVDLLASSGHKGLLGPLGTGVLYVGPRAEAGLQPLKQGGTGSRSDEDRQPQDLPAALESGNLNVPGILGLEAGVAWVLNRGIEELRAHELECLRALAPLAGLPGVTVYGPPEPEQCVGVLSLTVEGYDPRELATLLDSSLRVQTRAGLHCAPLVHRALGTDRSGGTLRFSPGPFTTAAEVATVMDGMTTLLEASSAFFVPRVPSPGASSPSQSP